MLTLPLSTRVLVCRDPIDMRRSFDGLEAAVRERLREDPLSGALFVFWNRRRDRLKILSFDGSGLWIWYKRLERGRFEVPGMLGDSSRSIRGGPLAHPRGGRARERSAATLMASK